MSSRRNVRGKLTRCAALGELLETRDLLAIDVGVSIDGPSVVQAGEPIRLSVRVTNAGPEAALDMGIQQSGVVLEDATWTGRRSSLILSDLDGTSGFIVNGLNREDALGSRLRGGVGGAGDLNGDGLNDIMISPSSSGDMSVIFGSSEGFGGLFDLSSLDGESGFIVEGVDGPSSPTISEAGDINGDGLDDIIIGFDGFPPDQLDADGYVVFGSMSGFGPSLDMSSVNGKNGFAMDVTGFIRRVSNAGDVNGDGVADVLIGVSPRKADAVDVHVLFGAAAGLGTSVDLDSLDGSNGFVIPGVASTDSGGPSLHAAGDVNGDGLGDILVGQYVVFGSNQFDARLETSSLNGSNGFMISDVELGGGGDVNGDGFSDVIAIGQSAAAVYVLFGSAEGFADAVNIRDLDAQKGFVIQANPGSAHGLTVTNAGDVSGDGIDDILIGDRFGAPPGFVQPEFVEPPGAAYVVFGSDDIEATIVLSQLDGEKGFAMHERELAGDVGGEISSAGDVNGDGIDDVLIGAHSASPSTTNNGIITSFTARAGRVHIVFGRQAITSSGKLDATINIPSGETITYVIEGAVPSNANGESETTLTIIPASGQTDADDVDNTASLSFTIVSGLLGDINKDGVVAFSDFLILASNFGKTEVTEEEGDLNGDGEIALDDFLILSENFGRED